MIVERKEWVKEMGGKQRREGRWKDDSDGDPGRYEGKRAVYFFFLNMKDKDEEGDGFSNSGRTK